MGAKSIGSIIGIVLALVLALPVILAAVAYIGFFYGIILSWIAGGVLTDVFGIQTVMIPTIMAWLFVIGTVLSVGGSRKNAE